ncbi:MAG: quinol dehydrogenase ferredoxin subunit NapH [Magnetococcales bacterium]|nr:quinol dehydrogenase ferredoxin subunit NapH [Magnetococcales bacterium]
MTTSTPGKSQAKGFWQSNKWLFVRRMSQFFVLTLFLLGPWFGIWIIKGNLSASLILDTVPLTDPLLALQMWFASGTLAKEVWIGLLVVTVFYGLVGGRLFCSWACPVNLVTDGAHWVRGRLKLKSYAKLTRNLRYWVLGMVLLVSALLGVIAWEPVNPVSIMHREIIFGLGMGWTILVGIFLLDAFFAERAWCSHLCPMGATYSLVGQWSPLRIRSEKEKCDECGDCYYICPEPQVIVPAIRGKDVTILDAMCTNCGRCIDICPQEVFRFGKRQS